MENVVNSVGVYGGLFAVGFFFPGPFQVLWMPKLITQYMMGIRAELIKGEYYSIYNLFFMSQFF